MILKRAERSQKYKEKLKLDTPAARKPTQLALQTRASAHDGQTDQVNLAVDSRMQKNTKIINLHVSEEATGLP